MNREDVLKIMRMNCLYGYDHLEQDELVQKDLLLLMLIMTDREDTTTVSDLAACLHITPAAVSQLVDRFEKRGLIERKRNEFDKRIVYVVVSKKGKECIKKSIHKKQKEIHEYLDLISNDSIIKEIDQF